MRHFTVYGRIQGVEKRVEYFSYQFPKTAIRLFRTILIRIRDRN